MTPEVPSAAVHHQASEDQQSYRWPVVSKSQAGILISVIAGVAACTCIALQAPGQVSMDTSVQLYEASIGQSISYNPPFMSALMRWLGGGSVATSLLVLINAVLLYGSFALTAVSVGNMGQDQGRDHLPYWRIILAIVIVLNPIIFLYAGIVWKDVLFASLLTSGCALTLAASTGGIYKRYACALGAIAVLAAGMITRQQGIFMVPCILLAVIVALWPSNSRNQKFYVIAGVIAAFLVSVTVLQKRVDAAIKPPVKVATSVGFRNLMIFDLAGMVSDSDRQASDYAFPITPEQLTAIRQIYTPERVDTLDRTPFTQAWVGRLPNSELSDAWWAMLKQNPGAYAEHRLSAFGKLIGLYGLEGTLPIHIGVEGNPSYLKQVGIGEGRDQRSQLIYDIAVQYFTWPIYRHFFWLGALVLAVVIGVYARLPRRLLLISALIAAATALMYASYLPTAIAADFRYLFGAIPLVMMLFMVLLMGGRITYWKR